MQETFGVMVYQEDVIKVAHYFAGLSLGVANKFLEPFAGAVLAKIAILVFIILFIQRRPRGLFPQRGRAADA